MDSSEKMFPNMVIFEGEIFISEKAKNEILAIRKNRKAGIFGDWKVMKCGDVKNTKRGYTITKQRILEKSWLNHVRTKPWCNANDFIDAYMCALNRLGIKELTIEV